MIKSLTRSNILQCVKCFKPLGINNFKLFCPDCGEVPILTENIYDLHIKTKSDHNEKLISKAPYTYIFVFSETIEKTDIQYQELYHLISRYSLGNSLLKVVYDHKDNFDEITARCNVEINPFTNSCLVKSENKLDIKEIVRNSGYIHSAGEYIYASQWSECKVEQILIKVKEYSKKTNKKYEIFFYTDLEHRNYDQSLPGIMIDYQRTYLGDNLLRKEVADIKKYLEHFHIDENMCNNDIEEVIFIYRDTKYRALNNNEDELYRGQNDNHYIVMYHSMYKKENPCHILDEFRPYWAGIYTTPHNLTCAMVNIAKIEEGNIVYDPFLHMGTTAIEAAKYKCKVIGSDNFEPIGALDNYNFIFNNNPSKILKKMKEISEDTEFLNRCFEIVVKNDLNSDNDIFLNFNPIDKIMETEAELKQFEKRLIYYILRRFHIRNEQGILEKADLLTKEDYLNWILDKINVFCRINQKNWENPDGWFPDEKSVDDFKYNSFRVGPRKHLNKRPLVFRANASRFPLKDNSIDAIITDPPYGYGDDLQDLRLLYKDFLSESFRVLRSNGRIVMCVLDKVKTGKKVDAEIMTKGIISLIENLADVRGIYIIKKDIISLPGYSNINYWKSKHALNRAILNLEIVKKK